MDCWSFSGKGSVCWPSLPSNVNTCCGSLGACFTTVMLASFTLRNVQVIVSPGSTAISIPCAGSLTGVITSPLLTHWTPAKFQSIGRSPSVKV